MLEQINPGDGTPIVVGPLGLVTGTPTPVDVDPSSGDLWMAGGAPQGTGYVPAFYKIDKVTGSATLQSLVSGVLPFDGLTALAIETPTQAWVVGGWVASNPIKTALYRANLVTGVLVPVGLLQLPFVGEWRDLAMLPDGDIAGMLWRFNGAAWPVFRIDPLALSLAPLYPSAGTNVGGLAIGPGTSVSTYCTGKTNSAGCVPTMGSRGFASIGASAGFTVYAEQVRSASWGRMCWSVASTTPTPFGGGYLCTGPSREVTPVTNSNGSPPPVADCSGAWGVDMNTWLAGQPALPAGTTVYCQWIGRDPGVAPQPYQLSNALAFTLKL
ncbi:MAG: hypothetical protein IT454_16340 [Planctomycetes bacterium]|nr:hypothetical protein [Planctomycetota bacterium]